MVESGGIFVLLVCLQKSRCGFTKTIDYEFSDFQNHAHYFLREESKSIIVVLLRRIK